MSSPKQQPTKKKKDDRPSSTAITNVNVYAMGMNEAVRTQLGALVGTPYHDVVMDGHTYRIREHKGEYSVGKVMSTKSDHANNTVNNIPEVTQVGVSPKIAEKVLKIYKKTKRSEK
ncbi:MAG: hypothetical protein KJ697_02345 [Nanoarchaeota archaeon]|nr:hypothetical protein [Nanoarchaeota archaeon]